MTTMSLIETLARDVRYAVRMLRKAPAFTIASVLTLALGIGANTAVVTVVDALLFTPLPYPQPDRLGMLEYHTRDAKVGDNRDTGANGRMWFAVRDHAATIDAAAVGGTAGVNLVANGRVAYVQQQRVSAGYFRVVGLPPLLGREFQRDEDVQGGAPVCILSFGLWKTAFNGDPSVVGRSTTLRGQDFTVVGVLPDGFPVTQRTSFSGGEGVDIYTPLRASTDGEGGGVNYSVVARLRAGVTWPQAQGDVRQASSAAFVNVPEGSLAELGLVPMQAAMTAEVRQPLLMLWGAVGIVLLIACVNIAGLLLARGATRTREIATRLVLGSGRGAVVRQLLVESLVLALLGGALGVAVGWGVLSVIGTLGAQVFDLWQPLALNGRVLLATLGIALVTSLLFGLFPAWQASRFDLQGGLGEGGTRAVAGTSSRWPRRILVVVEVALGVVLLISGGLLIRTFVHLRDLDPGFDERNLVTVGVSLQDARYRDPIRVQQLFEETLRRIRSIPSVDAAGVALGMPYSRLLNNGMRRVDGAQVDGPRESQITNMSYVTPGYFEALKVPVRQGRAITDADTAASPMIAVVNDAFVARYFKDDPTVVGRHIRSGQDVREIVGIVGNVQQAGAGWGDFGPISPLPCLFVPVSQTSSGFLALVHTWFQPSWAVRTNLPLDAAVPRLREALAAVDPQLPIAQVHTIDSLRGEKLVSQRFMMLLVAGLGGLAMLLSAIGLHGLISSSVNERRRELGIRLALGASGPQVLRNVVLPGIALALMGVVLGSFGALAGTRLLQSFLWGVQPTDAVTFAAVVVSLLAVAVVATLTPALRVLRIDPATALRND